MFKQLFDLGLAVATGDVGKAIDVLHEAPADDRPAPRKEGDPPCGMADSGQRCTGHGPDGVCIMGEVK